MIFENSKSFEGLNTLEGRGHVSSRKTKVTEPRLRRRNAYECIRNKAENMRLSNFVESKRVRDSQMRSGL